MLNSFRLYFSVLKALLIFIFVAQLNFLYAQLERSGGGFFDSSFVQMQTKVEYPVTRDALPSNYSLKIFAPPAGDQGDVASCYSWATAYAGLTMVKRIENGNDTISPFSAMNLFNRLKTKNNEPICSYGSYGYQNLNLLKNSGCPQINEEDENCMTVNAGLEFPNKLYNWQLIRLNEHTLKSALLHHQPIVFLIKQYDGNYWGNSYMDQAHWNGKTSGKVTSYHAMCIVGYDDAINGGSYHVLNSWGKGFGDQGYFWIRYADFERETVEAFSLIPEVDRAKKILDNKINTNNVKHTKEQFVLTNTCNEWAYVAISSSKSGKMVTDGWYAVAPNNTIEIDISQRQENTFFWYAHSPNQKLEWKGNELLTLYPVQLNNSFQSMVSREDSTQVLKPLIEANPIGSEIYTQTLLCPIKHSENVKVALHYSSLQSSNDKKFNNQYWTSAYPLFDYYTEEYIETASGSLISIWVTNGKKRPKQKMMTVEELEKCHLLKFSSEENALNWLEINL